MSEPIFFYEVKQGIYSPRDKTWGFCSHGTYESLKDANAAARHLKNAIVNKVSLVKIYGCKSE